MMHAMDNADMGFAFPLLWALHILGSLVFFIGITLLIAWMIKTLNQTQLKLWGISMVIVGSIFCILTYVGFSAGLQTMHREMTDDGGMENMNMMQRMMHGDDHSHETDDMMNSMMNDDDHMSMSMNDMSGMLQGKTGDAFDKAFIDGMIPHHQGAIDMARAALESAKHEEIKRMAEDIISAQQQEIESMQQWRRDWGYEE